MSPMVARPRLCFDGRMIDCRPLGICSWDFELRGDGHVARLGFGWPTEQGWISIGTKSYQVEKQGFLSGAWQLLDGGKVVMGAQKRNALTRAFDLATPSGSYLLEADFFATRSMSLEGPSANAGIKAAHAFTRRAVINGQLPAFEITAFAFWLTALTWRRAARSHAAAG